MANKKNRTLSMDKGLSAWIDSICVRHGDLTWHIENAIRMYRDSLEKPEKKKKAKKTEVATVPVELDFSNWPQMPLDNTLIPAWIKAKKKAGGSVDQRAITRAGNQLTMLVNDGYCVDQILEKAIDSNWKGLDAEWFKGRVFPIKREDFVSTHTDRSWADSL